MLLEMPRNNTEEFRLDFGRFRPAGLIPIVEFGDMCRIGDETV